MIKKTSRICVLFITLVLIFSAHQVSQAKTLGEMMTDIGIWRQMGEDNAPDVSGVVEPIADIGSILTAIGVAVMLGVVSYMGIKYLTSGPEARAKLKIQLIGVVVAGLVIFGAYYIWEFVVDIGEKL